MKVVVNGSSHEVNATTLAGVLEELGYGSQCIATAVNSEFVPIGQRDTKSLRDGDAIEIVAPMQGG